MSLRSVTLESTSMVVDSSSRCLLNVDGDTVHDHSSLGQTPCPPSSEPHNKQCGAGPRGKAFSMT
jgi:hypothetical protein